jgi:hypothetical protein
MKELKKRQPVTIRFKTATVEQFQSIGQRKLWAIIDDAFQQAVQMYGRMFGVQVKIFAYYPKKTASKDVLIEFAKHLQQRLPADAPMVFTI